MLWRKLENEDKQWLWEEEEFLRYRVIRKTLLNRYHSQKYKEAVLLSSDGRAFHVEKKYKDQV